MGHLRIMLEASRRIAASSTVRRELGERGYRAFVEKWSTEAHMRKYFELLENIALDKFGCVPWQDQAAHVTANS